MVEFLISKAFLFAMFVMEGSAYLNMDVQGCAFISGWRLFEVQCLLEEMRYFCSSWIIQVNLTQAFPTYFRRKKDNIIIIMYKVIVTKF